MRANRFIVGQHDGAVDARCEAAGRCRASGRRAVSRGPIGEPSWPAVQAAEVVEEEIDQQVHVVAAVAQRRQMQLETLRR